MYEQVTNGVRVNVWPSFLEDQSEPTDGHFFWAYTVEITNETDETLQLTTRHWLITDANGEVNEVRGTGVVGEQPVLTPGATFRYTSGAPLGTPSGFMTGSYGMRTEDGEQLTVEIPTFSLDTPGDRGPLN